MFGLGRPDARTVAIRAMILRIMVIKSYQVPLRGELPALMQAMSDAEKEAFEKEASDERHEAWEELGPLKDFLTPRELAYFKTDKITMTERQHIDATHRIKAFAVLAWALGKFEALPPYDVGAPDDLLETVPNDFYDEFIRKARLRPKSEISLAREVAELWHWRSRTKELVERGKPFPSELARHGLKSFDDVIQQAVRGIEKDGLAIPIQDGDFSIFGKAFRDLNEDESRGAFSVILERHFTLNWLCGLAPGNRWDETPTET